MTRFLGIDYGDKRVGIALSDEEARLAFPEVVFENDNTLAKKISGLAQEKQASGIVIGESLDYENKKNPIMVGVEKLKDSLAELTHLPVFLEPEFLTTQEALRLQAKDAHVDARAAALILQSFLDKRARDGSR